MTSPTAPGETLRGPVSRVVLERRLIGRLADDGERRPCMDGRRLRMRRLTVSLAILVSAAGWAGAPSSAQASCASTATLEQSAQNTSVAIFTGRATREMPESGDVVFAVDRWFHGPHAARVVRLLDSSAYVVEPPTAGVIRATLAKTVSGDAILLVRDQPVLMVAAWDPASGAFGAQACGLAGVPLDSAEGRTALAAAVALFGPGRPAVNLPATDALDPGPIDTPVAPVGVHDFWPLVVASALAAGFVLARRRIAG
jgi:hypothetical protein